MKKHSRWYWLNLSHEVRMWLKGLGLTGLAAAAYLETHPETKWKLEMKLEDLKEKFKKK